MERKHLVSKILELQGNAAKTSTLTSQNEQYGKRTQNLEEEVKKLRNQLKQVEVQKNSFERDIAIYVTENKNLKAQLEAIKSAHNENETTSFGLLQEIKEGHKKVLKLKQTEFDASLENMKDEMQANERKWNEKLQKVESSQVALHKEKVKLEEKLKIKERSLADAKIASCNSLENIRTEMAACDQNWKEKVKKLEMLQVASNKDKHRLQEIIKEKEKHLEEAAKSSSTGLMKNQVHLQALETKLKKSEEGKARLTESHKSEMQKLERQLEEREKQLGSQSNISKRLQNNLKSDLELGKQEVKAEIEKNKDLNNQLLKQKLKIQSLTENLKSSEEERGVKIKYYEDQVLVLRKELETRSCKVDELQNQVMEAGEANSSEIHDLNQKMIFLKKEKRGAQNKIVELTEELESVKKSKSSEMEKMLASHQQEIEKLRKECKEKESKTTAQSCISRKVQENMKRQLDCAKEELENEKIKNSELNVEIKRLEVRLKNVQESVKNSSDEKSLKLKLAEEERTAVQQELTIKNNKLHELQKQLLGLQEVNGKDLEELTEKLASAKREKRTAQMKITELLEEINEAERQKSRAEMMNRLSNEKQEKLTQQLAEAVQNTKDLEQKMTLLQDDLNSQKANSNSSSEQLRKQLGEMKTIKRRLEQEMKEKEMAIEKLNRDQDQFKQTAQKAEKDLKTKLKLSEEKLRDLEEENRERTHEMQVKLDHAYRDLSSKQKASENYSKKLREAERKKEMEVSKMKSQLEKAEQEIEDLKEEKASVEEKFNILRENCMVIETLEEQIDEYQQKCQQLQDKNSSLIDKLGATTRLKADSNREVEKHESEKKELTENSVKLEKEVKALKQTCVLMEEQIEDLEKFNNQLLTNQEEIKTEKENAVKTSRELKAKLDEVEHLVALEKRRGCELEDYKQEEIIECQVKMREKENEVHELQDTLSDLERKYKMTEMQASTMQKKLSAEKEENSRLNYDIADLRTRLTSIEKSKHKTTDGLRAELERADELARQVTDLQNQLDTIKMKNSHETIKMNCTIAQQSKLIDFLQAKVENLEPHDSKKKKKKKNDLYQVPLQYRELQEMLEEEKQRTIQLQQKVNNLRTELQNTKSDFGRLKHGINGPASSHALSPGSVAAITALVRSPNFQTPTQSNSSKSKHRMHHNIPHRLVENLCTHATKCHVCLDTLRFGRVLLRCSECHVTCHIKCRSNMTSACGLPGGLVQHFKNGGKAVTASPVSCISAGEDQTDVQGWLKVLCGGSSWQQKWVKLHEGVIILTNSEKPNLPAKRAKVDTMDREVIDLMKQQGYVHSMVSKSELDNTAGTDIPYCFKLELGPDTSCWPPRSIYFLASGFTDKQKWVKALEAITTQTIQNPLTDSKVLGNKILSLHMNEKLEINCTLPVSKEKVLFGCDEGLFILTPSTVAISDRSQLVKISGLQQVLQMSFLKQPNLIVAIEGPKRRVVTCDVGNLIANTNRNGESVSKISAVDDVTDCHLFAVGSVEGSPHLCAASAAQIKIFRFNIQLGKFIKRKEIATIEPCTCLQFTMCSIIMGTNKFYEVEMKSYKVDEFLDSSDKSLHFANDSFPVSVLQIAQKDGKQEYLLCYHEFGVFVDGFGKRSRQNNITWSRLPLSFAYRSPYLIVTHFYSLEILKVIDHNDNIAMQQAYLNIPSPRYLGSAITEGAVYLSGNDCGKITVYCCKGNMDNDNDKENEAIRQTPKSCLKRRRLELAASSQESLDDITERKKAQRSPSIDSQSTMLSGSTNFESTRSLSGSCDSLLSCNTSRWTLESRVSRMPMDALSSPIQRRLLRGSRESMDSIDSNGSSDATLSKLSEDDNASTQSGYSSSRLMWKPVTNSGKKIAPEKPVRKSKTPNRPRYNATEV